MQAGGKSIAVSVDSGCDRVVVQKLQAMGQPLDVAWGVVMRPRVGEQDLPGTGGPGDPFGIFAALYYTPAANGTFTSVSGDSFLFAVQYTPALRAQALLTYGNASQPDSAHRGDQLALYANKVLRPGWPSLEDIKANLEGEEQLDRRRIRAARPRAEMAGLQES